MNGERVGSWSLTPTGDELRYDEGWVASTRGRPLSLSMPFQPGNPAHRGQVVRTYFDNLLPDSRPIRQRIAQRFGAASVDAFDLLAEVGRDCAGALYIADADSPPGDIRIVESDPLDEAGIAELLRNIGRPVRAGYGADDRDDLRISIAGAQEKTALLWDQGRWSRPKKLTPTTHIFKLPLGRVGNMQFDLSNSVENEWLCSKIFEAFGLPVARCHPLRFEDQRVLAVERFDRRWVTDADAGNWLMRLPQEDMCQATATPPDLKYESDGGPGIDAILNLLNASAAREHDREVFFRSQFLFWLLRAPDGHAKNFSIALHRAGRFALTPIYDVMSAYPLLGKGAGQLSPVRVRMAMAVRAKNPHWRMNQIMHRHWSAMGQRNGVVGVDGSSPDAIVRDMIDRTAPAIETVSKQLPPDFPAELFESISAGLLAAAKQQ